MSAGWAQRLTEEYDQLTERLGKLENFIDTTEFTALPPVEQADLREQQMYMTTYRDVLLRRIARIPPEGV